jgi:hypothetical protein
MRYALINLGLGKVVNVVEIDSDDGSVDPNGCIHVQSDSANIGDIWDGSSIISVSPPDNGLPSLNLIG